MTRSFSMASFAMCAFVAGALGMGMTWSAGDAAAAGPAEVARSPGKPVQSNASTAASGRRPLAVRIAMADKLKSEPPSSPPAEAKPPAAEAAVAAVTQAGGTEAAAVATTARKPSVPRLLIDCEESTVDARQGELIRWRVTIRNEGATAHHVVASLYFAEGIEPTAAAGHGHSLATGEAKFSPVASLREDDSIQLEVTGRAVRSGAVAYRIEVGCRDLPGHVAREAVILVRPTSAE